MRIQAQKSGVLVSSEHENPASYRDESGRFVITAPNSKLLGEFLAADCYSAAVAYINAVVAIRGELTEAVRFFRRRNHSRGRQWWFTTLARIQTALDGVRAGKKRAARDIQFHYDRSNDFYRLFLDSRMVYSAAHFARPDMSLEEAQLEKLERIFAALNLRPGERLLDIGCGWGALVTRAVERYGATAVGCTLSHRQFEYTQELVHQRGLDEQVRVVEQDYRDLDGTFDKITSIGMFEHVGKARLNEYFQRVHTLLKCGGRFLNRGIVRPENIADDPETLFLQRSVFPGGGLVHLADVIREAEKAGFQVLSVEDCRVHYARTCRAWLQRLQNNARSCAELVGSAAYRTWVLYLAGSAASFEDGTSGCVQVLLAKS